MTTRYQRDRQMRNELLRHYRSRPERGGWIALLIVVALLAVVSMS